MGRGAGGRGERGQEETSTKEEKAGLTNDIKTEGDETMEANQA